LIFCSKQQLLNRFSFCFNIIAKLRILWGDISARKVVNKHLGDWGYSMP
jgi:hypothetical protein